MKKRVLFSLLLLVLLTVSLTLTACQGAMATTPSGGAATYFEVVFVDDDGTVLKTETVEAGKAAVAPEMSDKDGMIFAGWDTDFSQVNDNMTVTATYTRFWTVQFLDASGNPIKTYSVLDGEAAPTPPINPYKENHTFASWDQDYSVVTSDMTIRPVFTENGKLTVTFIGFNGEVLKTQQVFPGESAAAPFAPAVQHHTFKGWDKAFTQVNEDLTVTAVYEENAKFTVSFYDHNDNLLSQEIVYIGEGATAPSLTLAPHFNFEGWNKDFSNVQSDLDVKAIVVEDAKFTVVFLDKDGSVLKSEVVYQGENATAPDAPVHENFLFVSWDKAFTNVQSDLTVQAIYQDNSKFSVIFRDKDGNVLKAEDVAPGENATAPDAPAVENYTFAGWDTDFTNVQGNLVVTATYTENPKFTVEFVDFDGNVLKNEVVYVGKDATAPANPSRENYEFTGWV